IFVVLQQRGQGLFAERLPRLRIAEEFSDVDEDGAYQLIELARMGIDERQILAVIRDAKLFHPPAGAAAQCGVLVSAQLELVTRCKRIHQVAEILIREHGPRNSLKVASKTNPPRPKRVCWIHARRAVRPYQGARSEGERAGGAICNRAPERPVRD